MSVVTPPSSEQQSYIRNIAASFANTNAGIETQDIVQELYLKWYDKWESIRGYVEDSDPEQGKALILRTLQNWALAYCKKESAAINGGAPEDVYVYSRKQITALLPMVENTDAWVMQGHGLGDGMPRAKKQANQSGDLLAHYADLTAAWSRLTDDQRAVLRARYSGSEAPYSEVAAELGVTEASARKAVERAVTAMQKHMGGGKQKGEPRRKAVSNATAQVMTREAWNGD